MHSERDRELEEPEKKETLEWEGGISIDVQQWYELRCEDDNVGVFSAIFYKGRYSGKLARWRYKNSRAHLGLGI